MIQRFQWIVLASFVISVLIAPEDSFAVQQERVVVLDRHTRSLGATVSLPETDFRVAVSPDALKKESRLILNIKSDEDKERYSKGAPQYHTIASPIYQFDLPDVTPSDLRRAILLSIRSDAEEGSIAFYDRTREEWRLLPTRRYKNGNFVAETRLTYSQVALIKQADWNIESRIIPSLIPARSVLLIDSADHVYAKKAMRARVPIASITKLMTALVFLDHNPGWDTAITISAADDAPPSKIIFRKGEQPRVRDLFKSMIIGSKNNAAKALARSTGIRMDLYVELMNKKASVLGMNSTRFTDVTGLSSENVSTASDIVKLLAEAFQDPAIRAAASAQRHSFRTEGPAGQWHTVWTTNELFADLDGIRAAKTGYISESGYNFVLETSLDGERLYALVFGAVDDAARFTIAKKLVEHARALHTRVSL
ncbi:D-alanyl-D-alanine carboxypeptidase [Candidatus Uhrbacteria bacterium]|nr:D-alanyl-D-alanine carboxypeptidase [Candidatus Uhrbacteria bacterium]